MNQKPSITIPMLPCESMDDTLAFWQSLGFEVTYRQRAPNPYAVVSYTNYEIHFFGLKHLPPENNFSMCAVMLADVEAMHHVFADLLRQSLGKVPGKGFPHITRMRPGQTRFTVVDNAGNSILFVKRGDEDQTAAEAYKQEGLPPLQKAFHLAARLRDFKHDDAAAAKALDVALTRHGDGVPLDVARAILARMELASVLEEPARLMELRAQLQVLALSDADKAALQPVIAAFDN